MSDDKGGLNGRPRELAAFDAEAGGGFSRRDSILQAVPPPAFSPCLSSSIFALFLLLHLWASLTAIEAPAAVDINDKASHCLAFAWLGTILVWSLVSCSLRWPGRVRLQQLWPWAALALFLYGLAVEGLQHLLPHRRFEWLDVAANSAGIATVLALSFVAWLRLGGGRRQRKGEPGN